MQSMKTLEHGAALLSNQLLLAALSAGLKHGSRAGLGGDEGGGRGGSGCAVSHQHCQRAEGHSKRVALCLAPSTPPLPPAQSMPNQ